MSGWLLKLVTEILMIIILILILVRIYLSIKQE
jgi:predicted nucleic acid-binding Zn ribbon protein